MIGRDTPVQNIVIFAPRWHDRKVLIAKHKVGNHNVITFTKAPTLPVKYYLSGAVIRSCPSTTNGSIDCFEVPLANLVPLEYKEDVVATANSLFSN